MLLSVLVACDWFSTPPPAPSEPPRPAPLTVTTLAGEIQPLPDPERVLVIEAVRSLDWCVYCVAQVRAWQEVQTQVEALDAQLLVLSPDPPGTLGPLLERRGFTSIPVAHVTPDVFARLRIPADPTRPRLPQTTTLVLDRDGTEIGRHGYENFKERVDPGSVLDQIAAAQGLPPAEIEEMPSPDWDSAATIALVRDGQQLVLDVVLAPGFHLYGARETTSIPVSLRLEDGTEAPVPPGELSDRSGIEAWLIEGAVRIAVPAPRHLEVRGEVGWQLCNDRSCSAPRHEPFALGPEEGRIIRPAQ